jgi:beta-xylosidase
MHNVPVAVSTDLVTWWPPADAMPVLPSWAAWGRTWAPGVVALQDHYVLYFAARSAEHGRQCIGAAVSDLPQGPYTPTSDQPLVCQLDQGGSIDPYPFVDASGDAYLLWKADGNAVGIASRLYSQRLRADGVALEGEPVELLRSSAGWERPLIENPAMTLLDGYYVLLYSGGWWESDGYATGYATCAGPAGPCTKVTVDGPIHRGARGEAGPGGAAVFAGPGADRWVVYHAWTDGEVGYGGGGARSLRFAPLRWGPTGLAIG